MLARVIGCAGCAIVLTAVFLALGQAAAQAGGGPGGGNPFGSVTCGQAYSPSCAVTAGTPRQRPAAHREAWQTSGR